MLRISIFVSTTGLTLGSDDDDWEHESEWLGIENITLI